MPLSATITSNNTNPDIGIHQVDLDLTSVTPQVWDECRLKTLQTSASGGSLRDPTRDGQRLAKFGYCGTSNTLLTVGGFAYRSPSFAALGTPQTIVNSSVLRRSVGAAYVSGPFLIWPQDLYTVRISHSSTVPLGWLRYWPLNATVSAFLSPKFSHAIKGLYLTGFGSGFGNSALMARFVRQYGIGPSWATPEHQQPPRWTRSTALTASVISRDTPGDAGGRSRLVRFTQGGQPHFVHGQPRFSPYPFATRASTNNLTPLVWGLPANDELGIYIQRTATPGTMTQFNITWYDGEGVVTGSGATIGPFSVPSIGGGWYALAQMLDFAAITPPTAARFWSGAVTIGSLIRCKWGAALIATADEGIVNSSLNAVALGYHPEALPTASYEDPNEWQPGVLIEP